MGMEDGLMSCKLFNWLHSSYIIKFVEAYRNQKLISIISVDFHWEMGSFQFDKDAVLPLLLSRKVGVSHNFSATLFFFLTKVAQTKLIIPYTNCPFKKNLDAVLLSLSSNNQFDSGFYNASSGENPDRATAMALCRGNVPFEKCRSCVNDSAHRILQECATQNEAVGWYHHSQIRYSNNFIYGVRDSSVMWAYMNFQKSPDPIGFSQTLRSLLVGLRNASASGTSTRISAAGELAVSSPSVDTIYAVIDCFPDLSSLDCNGCLSQLQSYIPLVVMLA